MSSLQQERRDEYAVGDKVYVIRRVYAGRQSTHSGTIVEKCAATALVSIDGKNGKASHREMVAWNKLARCPAEKPISIAENLNSQRPTDSTQTLLRAVPPAFSNVKLVGEAPQPEKPESKPAATAAQQVRIERPIQQAAPVAQEVPAADAPSAPRTRGLKFDDDLTAYLTLGQTQLGSLEAKQKDLLAIADECDAEAEKLVKEADKSRSRAASLEKQILALRTLNELATASLAVLADQVEDEEDDEDELSYRSAFSGREQQASI
jgi:hypothetical protein